MRHKPEARAKERPSLALQACVAPEHKRGSFTQSPIRVTARVAAVPVPGGFHDRPQLSIARLPTQLAADLVRRCYQHWRVARPARSLLDRHLFARHFLDRADDLAHAVTAADAEIV